jgi:hypothetical protein
MASWLLLTGLGFSLVGALVATLADAWLTRSLLTYLDAVEANVARLVSAVREGRVDLESSGTNLKRDDDQNKARTLKNLGGVVLAAGFALQLAGAVLSR